MAAVLGPGMKLGEGAVFATAEVYPSTGNAHLPPLPKNYIGGVASYIEGSLVYCGGYINDDPTINPTSSCHQLTPPTPHWEETFSMLQVTNPLHYYI